MLSRSINTLKLRTDLAGLLIQEISPPFIISIYWEKEVPKDSQEGLHRV
jgi:hypothetical protein